VTDFYKGNNSSQNDLIQSFIKKIHRESKVNFEKFAYNKIGWNFKEFSNNVKDFKMGKDLMRYIADYLNINIFVLNVENDSLIYIGEKTFCKYKKNIFLLNVKDTHYESVFLHDTNIMNQKSPIIKKILNSKFLIERLDCDFTHEKEETNFIVGEEDLMKYFNKEYLEKMETKIEDEIDTEMDTKSNDVESVDTKSDDANSDDTEDTESDDSKSEDIDSDETDDIASNDSNFSESNDTVLKESKELKESEKSIKKINNKTKMNEKKSPKDIKTKDVKMKASTTNTVAELKEMAKKLDIKLTQIKNGKSVSKTKDVLIDEINACL
jgi:hypothetical protein